MNANDDKGIQSIDSIEKYAIEKRSIYYIKMKTLNVIINYDKTQRREHKKNTIYNGFKFQTIHLE